MSPAPGERKIQRSIRVRDVIAGSVRPQDQLCDVTGGSGVSGVSGRSAGEDKGVCLSVFGGVPLARLRELRLIGSSLEAGSEPIITSSQSASSATLWIWTVDGPRFQGIMRLARLMSRGMHHRRLRLAGRLLWRVPDLTMFCYFRRCGGDAFLNGFEVGYQSNPVNHRSTITDFGS